MTDHPPPPTGGYWPSSASGEFSAPMGPPPALPASASTPVARPAYTPAYTPWLYRVCAWLLDYLPFSLIIAIGVAVLAATRETACVTDISGYNLGEFCSTGASAIGRISALAIFPAIALGYLFWNLGYRQGITGCSVGKSIMKFRLISEKTGWPIGFGVSLVREAIYLVAAAACGLLWFLTVLFPLWDAKRQTLVDKLFSTVCVPLPDSH